METNTEIPKETKKGFDINRYLDTERIKRVVKLDNAVYKEIRDDSKAFVPALKVLYLSTLIPMLFSFLYTLDAYFFHYNFLVNFGGYFGRVFGIESIVMLFFGMAVSLVLTVILLPIGWFIGAGILHLIAKALGGKSRFKGYMYATGYATAPRILAFIPFLGGIIAALWSLACLVVATRETQEFSTGKAILTILIPVIAASILALMVCLVVFYVFHTDPLIWMGLKPAVSSPYQYANYDELYRQYYQNYGR